MKDHVEMEGKHNDQCFRFIFKQGLDHKNCDQSPHSHDVDDMHVPGPGLRAMSARRYALNCQSSVP